MEQTCKDPKTCRESGYNHGIKGLMSMSPRCSDWSEGWREGRDARLAAKEEES